MTSLLIGDLCIPFDHAQLDHSPIVWTARRDAVGDQYGGIRVAKHKMRDAAQAERSVERAVKARLVASCVGSSLGR